MQYFPRLLDKIRLHARGALPEEYHANLGSGVDGWCLDYLRITYPELKERVLTGGTDEEILHWCFEKGRPLNKGDLMVWNQFMRKLGWNDFAAPTLRKFKAAAGLADRADIRTLPEFLDADEGRKPEPAKA